MPAKLLPIRYSFPGKCGSDKLELAGNSLQYHDFTKLTQPAGMDFNHLWVSQLGLQAEDIEAAGSAMKAVIQNLSMHEKSGFGVRTLAGTFALTDRSVHVAGFRFATEATDVKLDADAQFASLATLADRYPYAKLISTCSHRRWPCATCCSSVRPCLKACPFRYLKPPLYIQTWRAGGA